MTEVTLQLDHEVNLEKPVQVGDYFLVNETPHLITEQKEDGIVGLTNILTGRTLKKFTAFNTRRETMYLIQTETPKKCSYITQAEIQFLP